MNNIIQLIDINKNLIKGKYAKHMVTQLVKAMTKSKCDVAESWPSVSVAVTN